MDIVDLGGTCEKVLCILKLSKQCFRSQPDDVLQLSFIYPQARPFYCEMPAQGSIQRAV